MKKFIIAASLAAIVIGAGSAQAGGLALGIMVGEPTGLSGKIHLSQGNALDFGAAWSFSGEDDLSLHMDYLYHRYGIFDVDSGKLPLYFGVGGVLKFNDGKGDDLLGVRIPVGLDYYFADAPFDIFGEIVPLLWLTPDSDFDVAGAIGARFHF